MQNSFVQKLIKLNDFNRFCLPLKFIEKIYNYEITLDEAIEKQAKLKELINKLNNYGPRNLEKIEEKNRVSKSAKEQFDVRNNSIGLFEKGIFLYKDNTFKTKEKKESEEELEENKFFKYTENQSEGIKYELFEKHFNNVVPIALAKKLFETKDKNKNNKYVNVIKCGLHDLKNEIEEIEIEKPNKILKIVEEILNFN